MKLLKTCFMLLGFYSILATAYGFGIKDIQLVLDASKYLLLSSLSIAFMSLIREAGEGNSQATHTCVGKAIAKKMIADYHSANS